MDSKEKAKELVDRFLEETPVKDFTKLTVEESSNELLRDLQVAKQCALICVDEKIKTLESWRRSYMGKEQIEYLKEVKQEIEKL